MGKEKVRLSEVVNAIRTIKAFVDFRDKVNELLIYMASAGIDISKVNFNNPMSLMKAFSVMRKSNVDVDIETIFDELGSADEITFEEVENAVRVLTRYATVSGKIDSMLSRFSRDSRMGAGDVESLAEMFGLKVGSRSGGQVEESEDDVDVELTDEDIEEIRRIVRKYKSKGVDS